MKGSRIFRIAEFLVLLILLMVLAEKVMDYFVKNDYETKTSIIASGTLNADILIQGASRVEFGLNSAIPEKRFNLICYNTGINGSTIDEQLAALKLYLKNNKKPSYLFLEVTPLCLDKDQSSFHSSFFVPFLGDTDIASIVKREDILQYRLRYIPLLKYSLYNSFLIRKFVSGVKQKIKKRHTEKEGLYHGFRNFMLTWDGSFDELKEKNPNGMYFKLDNQKVQSLNDYLAFAHENKISLILYEAPIWKEAAPFYKNHDSIADIISQMAAKYDYPYISFKDLPMNGTKSNFANSMHLTSHGADVFTNIFCETFSERLKKLRLKNQ